MSGLTYDGEGNFTFTFSYQPGENNRNGNKDGLILKIFDTKLLTEPNSVDNFFSKEEIQRIQAEKDNLLMNYLFKTAVAVSLAGISIYGSPYLAVAASLTNQLSFDKKAGSVSGLDEAVGATSNSGKLGVKSSNTAIANLINYWNDKNALDAKLSKEYFKNKMEWFGTGGTFGMSSVGKDKTTIGGKLNFVGIDDPKIRYYSELWQNKGIGFLYDEKEFERVNDKIDSKIKNRGDGPQKAEAEKKRKNIQPLLNGGFKLETDQDIKKFLEMIDDYQTLSGEKNIQSDWRGFINK